MKIYIFGSSGSGKTTIAKKISQEIKVKHFDVDEIFYKFEKIKKNDKKREEKISKIISEDNWILEGMYRDKWLKDILISADFIFILNPSKIIIYWRIFKRTLFRIMGFEIYERKSNYRILFALLKTAKDFNKVRLPEFLSEVNQIGKKTIFIKNSKQILQKLNDNSV